MKPTTTYFVGRQQIIFSKKFLRQRAHIRPSRCDKRLAGRRSGQRPGQPDGGGGPSASVASRGPPWGLGPGPSLRAGHPNHSRRNDCQRDTGDAAPLPTRFQRVFRTVVFRGLILIAMGKHGRGVDPRHPHKPTTKFWQANLSLGRHSPTPPRAPPSFSPIEFGKSSLR